MGWVNEWAVWINQLPASWGWAVEVVVRLVVAAVLGGAIGLEREVRGHEAGLRTNMLVSLGCALAMIVSLEFARIDWSQWQSGGPFIQIDPARIAYGVMGGIGFLGAGAIMHNRGLIRGMTTAASIWCTAAIGLAAGIGMVFTASVVTALVIVTLIILRMVEPMFPSREGATVVLFQPGQEDDEQPPNILQVRDHLNKLGFSVKQLDLEFDNDHDRWLLTVICHHFEDRYLNMLEDLPEERAWRLHAIRRLQQ